MPRLPRLPLFVLLVGEGAKVYKCKWPRSVLSSGDPNLTVTLADGSEVRCDRTMDWNFKCPAACDYIVGDPDVCFGPIEDGDVCNTVWERNSQAFYKLTGINNTHACTQRFNSDCSADMGGIFCQELNTCYGSLQEVVFEQSAFVAKYGYEPSFLQQPWEILEPPVCTGLTTAECCMVRVNFYRCLHDAPPVAYHAGIASSAQAWADKMDKGSIHSGWGGDFYPEYTEVLTWGTDSCERGAHAWYAEIGVHNFSIPEVQSAGGSYTSGHMVILLWHNHTMMGCGASDPPDEAPIVVCDFSWPHQGHKGPDAWELNLKPRSSTVTQEMCRSLAVGSLQLPILAAGEDLSSEQVQVLQEGNLSGWSQLDADTTEAEEASTTDEASSASTTDAGGDDGLTSTTETRASGSTSSTETVSVPNGAVSATVLNLFSLLSLLQS